MRLPILAGLGLLALACDGPTTPDAANQMTIEATTPATGGTVVVPEQFPFIVPGGVHLPKGSGLISVRVSTSIAQEVPFARLNVYLLTGGSNTEYCGINDTDAPTWGLLPAGWSTTYTVTGFTVYQLPCEVTGFRVMLHMRNNGLFAPPLPSETVAEATLTSRLMIRR